jgi:hypothetical protein
MPNISLSLAFMQMKKGSGLLVFLFANKNCINILTDSFLLFSHYHNHRHQHQSIWLINCKYTLGGAVKLKNALPLNEREREEKFT